MSLSARAETLRLCHDVYPPYLLDDSPSGRLTGIKVALAERVTALSGIDLTLVVAPWKRCLLGAARGVYDGVLPLHRTPEREQNFLFTDAVFWQKSVFLYRKDRFPSGLHWSTFAEISQYSLAMVIGDHIDDGMEHEFQEVRPIERVRDFSTLLAVLEAGRVDLVAIDGNAARYMVHRSHDDQIAIAEQTVASEPMYFALSRSQEHAALIPRLNQALNTMRQDGSIEAALAATY